MNDETPTVTALRPYQLMCIACVLGEDESGPTAGRLKEALDTIRENPDAPVALRCNAGDVFVYQDSGVAEDTPEGKDYNRKRDLDILEKLDLAPGAILPARILLGRMLKLIPTTDGICAYDRVTSDAWCGCPKAACGYYEKTREAGISAIIPPRDDGEMARDKLESLLAMERAEAVTVRPHILVCAVAQYGGGTRPPFPPDNLPEFLQHILKHPDTPVTLVGGADWMMCAPCPSRVPAMNACVCGQIGSGGLYNELKDLNVLQQLGLTYGATMKARDIYQLIFDRIPSVDGVCALINGLPEGSVWRDGCGAQEKPCPGYAKGREELMQLLAADA